MALERLNYNALMSDDRIHRVTVKRIADSIRVEAEITLASGASKTITSSGIRSIRTETDPVHLKAAEDAQLSELRKRLYGAGFSKRAIASAIKGIGRVEERAD